MRRITVVVALLSLIALDQVRAESFHYPPSPRGNVVDTYFGTAVPDPWRWLENDVRVSDSVKTWVDDENKVTFAYLKTLPDLPAIEKRLTELWNYERFSAPFKMGGRYFYSHNSGLQKQAVLFTMDKLDGEPRVALDPNTLSADGTVALAGLGVSEDGRYMAWGASSGGSDWSEWKIRDLTTMQDLPETLKWIKWSGASWKHDGSGFFYSRYPAPKEGTAYTGKNEFHKIYFHRPGTDQSEDQLVYERPDQPDWNMGGGVTDDGHYLIVSISHVGDKNRVYYLDLQEPGARLVPLIDTFEAQYSVIGNDGPVFFVQTDFEAPRSRVVAIDTRNPDKAAWKTIVPEAADALQGASVINQQIVLNYLKDAYTRIRIVDRTGQPVREVSLPGIGTAGGFGGRQTDTETFYTFTSFTTPPIIYRYDMTTGQSTLFRQAKVAFDPDGYEVKQVFYNSKDGTRVPMFLVHRKGLALDGTQPTLLYAYGGFSISMTPGFSVSRLAWLEMGGVYAVACLRGGGEYGEDWHLAGTKLKKQNVFDDFIAAGEWLIANRYTSSARLGIMGGSNGGLLIGAVLNQRPELFGAAIPAVGVMDMLRYHKFTIGRAWAYDYGTSDDEAEFKALRAYSPYHNVTPGTKYPATLITTADHDDRVVPGHSFKYAAAIQAAQAGPAPVLIRIETSAGHGGGKPTSKQIEEVADMWAFLAHNLGMTVAGAGTQ